MALVIRQSATAAFVMDKRHLWGVFRQEKYIYVTKLKYFEHNLLFSRLFMLSNILSRFKAALKRDIRLEPISAVALYYVAG
jgi:hypothetical protein